MADKKKKETGFVLGTSAGPGVPVDKKEEKKPAEIVPAAPTAVATIPEKKEAPKTEEEKAAALKEAVAESTRKAIKGTRSAAKKAVGKETAGVDKAVQKEVTAAKKAADKAIKAEKRETAKAAKQTEPKVNVVLQYGDKNITYDTIIDNANNVWTHDLGRRTSAIKSMDLYVKPEDGKVYYVVNGSETGDYEI